MKLLCAALLVFLSPALAEGTTKPVADPFQPPSSEFCESNSLGDDAYISIFVPCEFVFYETTDMPDHFSCKGYNDETAIKKENAKVAMWPDSCVAVGPRCYSIADYPSLSNFTFYQDTEFSMKFPSQATVVSVNCTADFAKAQEFLENLPEELGEVAESIACLTMVLFVAVVAAIVACICCCCGACQRRRPHGTYMEVQPVQATAASYSDQPPYKAVAV